MAGTVAEEVESGKSMKWKVTAQQNRARDIMGMEMSRIPRLPRRSMRSREMMVKMKLVHATEREVRVGDANPSEEKMVAEKYMREF